MNNHYLPPHKVKRQGNLAEHFTLIPLDNYNNTKPVSRKVSGFSPFMELSRTLRGSVFALSFATCVYKASAIAIG